MIYCNGDSFVEGTELGDTLLPNHPGFLDNTAPQSKRKITQAWLADTYKSGVRDGLVATINTLGRERAWPNKLSKLVNKEVINAGSAGSSMDKITRTTINDLLTLSKKYKDITAIISTTCPDRFEVGHRIETWRSVLSHDNSEDTQQLVNYKVEHETEYHSFMNFFKNVIYIKNFCKDQGITLYFVGPFRERPTNIATLKKHKDLANLIRYADINYIAIMQDIANQNPAGALAPGIHFSEAIHDIFAQQLYEKITQ